jgi:hypothetical protein
LGRAKGASAPSRPPSTATPAVPFDKPKNGRIAIKVINHLRGEVMKVFRV